MELPFLKKFKKIRRTLGPGLITGAADDDPSGIATYSQTGAQFGFGQLWTCIFLLPLMIAVQEASARIGAVKGKGIAGVIKENYSKPVLYFIVLLLLFANTINLGVDIGAMAAATQLIFPLPFILLTLSFSLIILMLEIFTSYQSYARFLKWLSLSLLAYPLTLLIVKQPWLEVIRATFIPHLEFNLSFLFIIIGIIGTTISPYMFFWQASEVTEEAREENLIREGRVYMNHSFLKRLRLDNLIGMVASQIATWSIIVVGASVLRANGVTDIQTAADAAKALEPLVSGFPNAGLIAKSIFAIGVIGLGLLAVPVLSGSAAYAMSETFGWNHGLNQKLKQAPGFYAVIILATLIGLTINFLGINPIKALIYTAVMNGIVSIPLIFIIGQIAGNKAIMGDYVSSPLSKTLVGITFVVVCLSGVSLLFVR